eukprot:Rhum_TRINITY_DN11025_c0_g1::Rhum_TRINITY_DN11025_c0_g1_i1::g.42007::m.42007
MEDSSFFIGCWKNDGGCERDSKGEEDKQERRWCSYDEAVLDVCLLDSNDVTLEAWLLGEQASASTRISILSENAGALPFFCDIDSSPPIIDDAIRRISPAASAMLPRRPGLRWLGRCFIRRTRPKRTHA